MRCFFLPRRISQRISVDKNPHGRRLRPLERPLLSWGRSIVGSQGRTRRARGARDEPGAGVVIVAAAVTVGMGGSGPGHASSEENLKWVDEIRYLLSYLLYLYWKSSCLFHKENPSEKEIVQLKSDLKMRGEDAVDDEVGRGVDEDEQVRDRIQRDE